MLQGDAAAAYKPDASVVSPKIFQEVWKQSRPLEHYENGVVLWVHLPVGAWLVSSHTE